MLKKIFLIILISFFSINFFTQNVSKTVNALFLCEECTEDQLCETHRLINEDYININNGEEENDEINNKPIVIDDDDENDDGITLLEDNDDDSVID